MSEEKTKRNAAIIAEYEAGDTIVAIAERHKVSYSRALHLLYSPPPRKPQRPFDGPREWKPGDNCWVQGGGKGRIEFVTACNVGEVFTVRMSDKSLRHGVAAWQLRGVNDGR